MAIFRSGNNSDEIDLGYGSRSDDVPRDLQVCVLCNELDDGFQYFFHAQIHKLWSEIHRKYINSDLA